MDNQKRLKEIEKQLKKVGIEISKREKTDPNQGWNAYCQHMQPVWDKYNKLEREKRMLMTPIKGHELEKGEDDIMSLQDFITAVKDGCFIDSDGHGYYVIDNHETNIKIFPSDIRHNSIRNDLDTIVWYNK